MKISPKKLQAALFSLAAVALVACGQSEKIRPADISSASGSASSGFNISASGIGSSGASASANASMLDGTWIGPCTNISYQSYYRTEMTINVSNGAVTFAYPAYVDPACTHYNGRAASTRTNSLSLGNTSAGAPGITIVDQNNVSTFFNYSFTSDGKLSLQQLVSSGRGLYASGAPVLYRR